MRALWAAPSLLLSLYEEGTGKPKTGKAAFSTQRPLIVNPHASTHGGVTVTELNHSRLVL